MILTWMEDELYRQTWLPEYPEGHFVLRDLQRRAVLTFISDQGQWRMHLETAWTMHGSKDNILRPGMLLRLQALQAKHQVFCYAEPQTEDRELFARLRVQKGAVLRFGSGQDCEFLSRNPYIEPLHAVFTHDQFSHWSVESKASGAGVYVNGRKVRRSVLQPGDLVWILGQKFVVLPGMIALTSPSRQLSVHGRTLSRMEPTPISRSKAYRPPNAISYFNRMPRFIDDIESEKIDVDAPPAQQKIDQTSPLLTLGPSLTSGLFMLLGGMSSILSLGMVASNLFFPTLMRKRAQEQQEAYEERRKSEYSAYIAKIEAQIDGMMVKQSHALLSAFPSAVQIAVRLLKNKRHLWDHRPSNKDHLHLRLGTGSIPMKCDISIPQAHFDISDDPMRELLTQVRSKARVLNNVPIMLDFSSYSRMGICGGKEAVDSLTANILAQLSCQYGYDEMKFFMFGKPSQNLRPFLRLPHTWNNEHNEHMVAWDESELSVLLPRLDHELALRRKNDSENNRNIPELVVVLFDPAMAQKGVLSRLLFDQEYDKLRIIALAEHSNELPRKSDVLVGAKGNAGKMVADNEQMSFSLDTSVLPYVAHLVSMMENTFLDIPNTSHNLPATVSFLRLFDTTDVATLNVSSRYMKANPSRSLRTPIGIDEDGQLCYLDVHENVHGPHGLIAGMTGSGKSELIMTYILSMAVNFSPLEVSFFLIDYKGGGMASAFRQLPHTAGIMTNLDGEAIHRAIVSVRSELKRRQKLFHEAEEQLNESNMNIRRYQQCVRTGQLKTPLSHLLIITDEFAELKSQEPEFMKELISASRIGRSLGVHLILATQKPSGVVDDQIRSNTGWRLCLRVQDSHDSTDVIGSPIAADLTGVGRFYMQAGGSLLLKVQSGYTGADYAPETAALPSCKAELLDRTGIVLQQADLTKEVSVKTKLTQLSAVTAHLIELNHRASRKAQPLWLPPLEEIIPLASLQQKYAFTPTAFTPMPLIGEVDDLENQQRLPLVLEVCGSKNTMVYGTTGSGKEMLLQTLLQNLLLYHGPQELRLFLADMANDGLAACLAAPQVADVIQRQDGEKLDRLLILLEKEIGKRKQRLSGAEKADALGAVLKDAGLPRILTIFNGLHLMKDAISDSIDRLLLLLTEGPGVGIHFLAIAPSSGFGYKLEQSFANILTLQLAHADDYTMLLGRTGGLKPAAVRGRGLVGLGKRFYEFQTATADLDLEGMAAAASKQWPDHKADPIATLPQQVTLAQLQPAWRQEDPLRIPIALSHKELTPVLWDLGKSTVHQIIGMPVNNLAFLQAVDTFCRQCRLETLLLSSHEAFGSAKEQAQAVYRLVLEHIHAKSGQESYADHPRLILIPDLKDTLAYLSGETLEDADSADSASVLLETLMEKAPSQSNMVFVAGATAEYMQRCRLSPWYARRVDPSCGLLLGGQLTGQFAIDVRSGPGGSTHRNYPDGYVITGSQAQLVRFFTRTEGDVQDAG